MHGETIKFLRDVIVPRCTVQLWKLPCWVVPLCLWYRQHIQ